MQMKKIYLNLLQCDVRKNVVSEAEKEVLPLLMLHCSFMMDNQLQTSCSGWKAIIW